MLGMSPADHYAAAEKHSKYDEGFVGSGVTFCAVVREIFGGLSTEGMTLFKTVIGRAASRVAPHGAGPFKALPATSQLQLTALPGEDTEVR